jgi:hypothetical protein
MIALRSAVLDHLVGLDIIERMGGYPKAVHVIRNSVPTGKQVRSGDLGEIIATEYIDQVTEFRVPIRRLRYRDDRSMPMRGDDLIALHQGHDGQHHRVLKGEAKSGANMPASVIGEASDALCKYQGRPNPATLAFISTKLRRENRDDLAAIFEELQAGQLPAEALSHLIFALCGSDPSKHLGKHSKSAIPRIRRALVGMVVNDHPQFVADVYDGL